MTFLAAIADRGGWGAAICREASRRSWEWQLFEHADEVQRNDGYAFFRVHQHPTHRTAQDKREAGALIARGLKPIPDVEQIRLYEDKLAQSEWAPMVAFMPRTIVARDPMSAFAAAKELGYPLISKSACGSASSEVRLIRDDDQLDREVTGAFVEGGIRGRYAVQSGYVIFQEFLERNAYDYRVCAIGRQRMMLRRHNRSETQPFASGSGKCEPITTSQLTGEEHEVLETADDFFAAARTTWCGIDLVRDPRTGWWRVLEVTLAWTQKAYAECAFIGTARRGAEIWSVLCDEIENGVFG